MHGRTSQYEMTPGLLNTRAIKTTEELDALSLTEYVDSRDRHWLRFIEPADQAEMRRMYEVGWGSKKYVIIPAIDFGSLLVFLKH